MYVTLNEAKKTVWRRWHDLDLRRKVRAYVVEVPEFFRHGPRAVLARQQASPNFEFFCFSAAARKARLKAICPEYTEDSFCTINPDKLALGKMTFLKGRGRNGGIKISSHKIMDFKRYDGKPFTVISTLWGEGFIDFHHRLMAHNLPQIEISENSPWLNKMGGEPSLFWPRLLALFICHGILFDNFHTEGHEAEFTRKIIRPAIKMTEGRFGLKPLVVPLVPVKHEREPYWSWYPGCFEYEVQLTSGRAREHDHKHN